MYKSILVAIDGSHTSELALNEAIRFAKTVGARLRLVTVVDKVNLNWPTEYPNPAEIREALTIGGQALLDKAASTAAEAGVEADQRLSGDVGDRLRPEVVDRDPRLGGQIADEAVG